MRAEDIRVVYNPSRAFNWWIYAKNQPLECFSWRWTAELKANKIRMLIKKGVEVRY